MLTRSQAIALDILRMVKVNLILYTQYILIPDVRKSFKANDHVEDVHRTTTVFESIGLDIAC